MRHGGARARGGVDLADVVADLVGAQLRQLGADAGARPRGGRRAAARSSAARAAAPSRRAARAACGPGPWRAARRAAGCSAMLGSRPAASSCQRRLVAHGRCVGHHDGGEDALEDVVGAHAVGERVVGQHEAVAQHVGREVAHVADDDVPRPRSSASARAACTRPIGPRGLAPYSM